MPPNRPVPEDEAIHQGVEHAVWVFPPDAGEIAFWLLAIGTLVILGWWQLRGDSCWRCGLERGLCPHTRYDEPKDPHGGRAI